MKKDEALAILREFKKEYAQEYHLLKIGVRNVIAHGYFDVDAEQVFEICQDDIPALIEIVKKMIMDLG
ncbi:MAG: DUF86 domain-containing protein [Anaerolineae bacterium]|jgi:uncharacterized protein with HEPN domain|nr:DUF86 domain-containing protein [Anaerolineae bacterium]MBT3714866.1 DUF86 domain-containing protein [Anaerolineae bacterium]MBT4311197.1 DUF86 domain-containing protein [Anaerolineae bacterium]MBT4458161.1 DUF86 domain-containing protein [Anaerolineae bacterium]MBT6061809.1 DUF86 domain-containing protein [Anaerolineae bacterium]